jgi:hypothetical protein
LGFSRTSSFSNLTNLQITEYACTTGSGAWCQDFVSTSANNNIYDQNTPQNVANQFSDFPAQYLYFCPQFKLEKITYSAGKIN